jgi:hypothetical protein
MTTSLANGLMAMMYHKISRKFINEYKDQCGFPKINDVEFIEIMLQNESYINEFILEGKWLNYRSKKDLMYKYGFY